ncbi:thiamine pyrophosphate-dependent dehydrogenase E1 component subunit alpha [Mycobacterium riyadhense]|uniref:Dehydrogenase n=1 Tax=Mycobacterium riyadhense TaxID=486698 RepID=A0A1X2CRH6_9MYCO|nr:thiamine pyrophosphate-dependent dehydrogenase E1 component subunit alpha [Mycobacterium riyadhense]MCV7145465.1 thiamine pyrophosphate-dependent dehydrogenase E1 component subunit alpha [Mycobacterium riyadhense]ORW78565.1 dehydrogenase [Mycobacterium riyadhense]VTP02073.1 Acetoin:2,6-dichlorophenolindophenol oxidoreductase subunit alpha [Mycobacterium riyadhense]
MTCASAASVTVVPDRMELYRRMWVLRLLDVALEELRVEGLIKGPMHVGFGQEAAGIGATAALRRGDVTTATHRPHAQYVGLGLPLGPTIAEMMGRADGQCGGRGGHMLITDPEYGLLAPSGIVGHSLLLAVGHAYSQLLAEDGRVTLCVTGDGAVNSGAFNEAANMAALWQLPVVIFVENNRYALSVRLDQHVRETQLYRRASGYGMPGVQVDGNDVEAVRDCVGEAVQRARAGGGPTLVEAVTYRNAVFSGADRGGYREPAEADEWPDPLVVTQRRLIAAGVPAEQVDEVEREARRLVAEAVAFAKASPWPDAAELVETARKWDG